MISELGSRIDILTKAVSRLTIDQGRADLPSDTDEATLIRNTRQLKESAERVLSSASTIVAKSEAGSGHGSENGVPLTHMHRTNITAWIPPPVIPKKSSDGLANVSSPFPSTIVTKAKDSDQSNTSVAEEYFVDEDDDQYDLIGGPKSNHK